MSRTEQVVIIGAGVGGLACAIDLARRGLGVTVVEAARGPGGKMREVEAGGRRIDSGPTVVTMRWVFDDLFESVGVSLDERLRLKPADVLARHAWAPVGSDARRLDMFADPRRSEDAIGDFAGAREAAGFRAFCAESRRIFETLDGAFLRRPTTGPLGLTWRVGLGRLDRMFGLRPYETLWTALGDHFRDLRLRQLFGRYATYCGSSPFAAPATLMLIAHAERCGVWLVDGGVQRLAEALEALARDLGVAFRYASPVARIEVERGRARGVVLADGERLAADAVVMNGDPEALASGALGAAVSGATPRREEARRSLSAVTWSMLARTAGFPLSRHNVFFSDDYRGEFDDILERGRLPVSPTVYVCAQDRDEAGRAPEDEERLLVLVNAPARGDRDELDEAELRACERRLSDHLDRCGLNLGSPTASVRTTPGAFARMFPGTGGALYGSATHGAMGAFRRPGSRTRIPGLYLAGGGVHPGPGAPMAALSGRLAAEALAADLASTHRFPRAATPGGMSTRSATTAAGASP